MKSPIIISLIFCLITTQSIIAQIVTCGYKQALQSQTMQSERYQKLIDYTFEKAKNKATQAQYRSRQILTVPVVVHVVYNTPEQNISDELIHSQIQVLNEDFQRLNVDADDAREMYKGLGGNAEIQFVLAELDPDGNPTNGITRTQTNVTSFVDVSIEDLQTVVDSCGLDLNSPETITCFLEELFQNSNDSELGLTLDYVKNSAKGGQDPWDTERYINIWVCNLNANIFGQEQPMVLGFAYPPIEAPNWPTEDFPENLSDIDGLVIHHQAFGVNNPNAGMLTEAFNKGRTCTHEMGHYFGLRHVSGDGDCGDDDGISDTPPEVAKQGVEFEPNVICSNLNNLDSCPEDDRPDMYENFMGYNPEACQNLFTIEQVGIMRAMLEGPRAGLILQQSTSTISNELRQALTLYPNPASNNLNIHLEGYNYSDFEVEISDVLGKQILQLSASPVIDISSLHTGVYLVRLKGEAIEASKKISVLK